MKRCPSLASLTFLTAAATCALLSGCLSRPPLPTADVATPAAYRHASSAAGGDIVSADWWRSFGSVELDRLVAQASARNNDLAAAVARVKQARASATIAGAARLPSVTGFADASRVGGFMINDNLPSGSAFDLGLSASYEIDFWGKNRATRDAAIERVRASAFDRATVLMTLTADVADGWLQTVALRERETLAERNLHTAREILRTVESQFRAGYVTALDVAQQRTLVASQQRTVASLHQQADDSEALLATLLGVPGDGFRRRDAHPRLGRRARCGCRRSVVLARAPSGCRVCGSAACGGPRGCRRRPRGNVSQHHADRVCGHWRRPGPAHLRQPSLQSRGRLYGTDLRMPAHSRPGATSRSRRRKNCSRHTARPS
ncbi:TolC family protein [Caballeronia sp. LZ001]|nr:TolC family protein [Caballeronia sp. LZ001]MDR5798694.1 TolC family protein [Caballeronia sp. LZ001]